MHVSLGIGSISDFDPQPLIIRSHHGPYAIVTVGRINNLDGLKAHCFEKAMTHFQEMSVGGINPTELIGALINQKNSILEGLEFVQDIVEGSMSILLLNKDGIYAMRDREGRTPIILAKKEEGFCATFESSAFLNLGYTHYKDMGPGEIDLITPNEVKVLKQPNEHMKICSFLWVYYGYQIGRAHV